MAREAIRRDKVSLTLDDDLLNALEDASERERLPVAAIAADDRVVDHGVIVVAPIARVPAFDAGLGARFAE